MNNVISGRLIAAMDFEDYIHATLMELNDAIVAINSQLPGTKQEAAQPALERATTHLAELQRLRPLERTLRSSDHYRTPTYLPGGAIVQRTVGAGGR